MGDQKLLNLVMRCSYWGRKLKVRLTELEGWLLSSGWRAYNWILNLNLNGAMFDSFQELGHLQDRPRADIGILVWKTGGQEGMAGPLMRIVARLS